MLTLEKWRARDSVIALVLPSLLLAQLSCAPQDSGGRAEKSAQSVLVQDTTVRLNRAGQHLHAREFLGEDLTGAMFDGRELAGVRFRGCLLRNASFRGATLSGAWMGDCIIAGADFSDAVVNGLEPRGGEGDVTPVAFLSAQQLMSTRSYKNRDLRNCLISGNGAFDFRGADLRGATLVAGDFSKCDFTDARIEQLRLVAGGVTFVSVNESLHESLDPTSGDEYHGDRELRGGGFTLTHLCSTKSYRQRRLVGMSLESVDLRKGDFSRVDFTGSRVTGCDFTGSTFEGAVISEVQFVGCRVTVDQVKSSWNYKNNRMQDVVLPEHIAKQL